MIEKAQGLKDFLASSWLNFDILGWHIGIGEAVEEAIDWVVVWINEAIDWIGETWNKLFVLWDDFWRELGEVWVKLGEVWDWFIALPGNIWKEITDWWSDPDNIIRVFIDGVKEALTVVIEGVGTVANRIATAWDNFWTLIFPTLIDFNWWRGFWGGMFSNISDWWAPEKQKVTEETDAKIAPVEEEVNRHTSWWETFWDFLTNPLDWLMDRFIDWFLGE